MSTYLLGIIIANILLHHVELSMLNWYVYDILLPGFCSLLSRMQSGEGTVKHNEVYRCTTRL